MESPSSTQSLEAPLKWFMSSLVASVMLAGCSSLPPAPAKAPAQDYAYQIAPGDVIEISVWRNPEVSAKVPVRPDGRITSPLIDDMMAAGKTPSVLGREIEQTMKKYIREPTVTVLVTQAVGSAQNQVRVVGQAAKPAAIPFRQGMTLLDVMITVGGITDFASGNRSVLIRQADNNRQYAVRLHDLLKRGDVTANVEVVPGDVIMIPEGMF